MEICVFNTQDIFKAEIAQSKLESFGIPSELRTNDATGTLPHLGILQGAQIYVSEMDVDKAREVLRISTANEKD